MPLLYQVLRRGGTFVSEGKNTPAEGCFFVVVLIILAYFFEEKLGLAQVNKALRTISTCCPGALVFLLERKKNIVYAPKS